MSSDLAASALKWWHDAGVDALVAEEPRDWLAAAPPAPPTHDLAAPEPPAPEALPADLDAFRTWLASPGPFPGTGSTRHVGPSGDPASGLMILVDMPSAEDEERGRLLSGEVGELFDRMLAAIGRSRETIYLASISGSRTPNGRIGPAQQTRLAAVARHHVGLVNPRALLLFGDACAKLLVGAPVAGSRGRWHALETDAGAVRTLVTIRPQKLLTQPTLKKIVWEDLKTLMEELKS